MHAKSLVAAVLATLGALTWNQAGMYRDSEALWQTTIARNPDSWLAHFNLGSLRLDQGFHDEAMKHFGRVLDLQPDNAGAHYNIGKLLAKERRYEAARKEFACAVRLGMDSADVHFNLGLTHALQTEYIASVPHYERALQRADFFEIRFQLGHSLLRMGRARDAVLHLRKAAELRPDVAGAALAEALAATSP